MAKTQGTTAGLVSAKTPGMGQRLSANDWVTLASAFGPALIGAAGGAAESSYNRKRQEQLDAIARANEEYTRRMGARAGLSSFYADQLAAQRSGAQALANAMPLGAEQDLALRMGAMRGLSDAGLTGPQAEASTNPVLQARLAAQPAQNFFAGWARPDVMQAISPEATARSIAERRKALAGLDPNFQFGNMGDYGVPDLGGEVSGYAGDVRNRRAQTENTLLQYLQQQMDEANQPLVPTTGAGAAGGPEAPKKTPWWKRALKVAATAAPIVAAPFTGGTSLALIGAGSGALAGALDGGWKGAMMGGALGATAGLGGGAGNAAWQKGKESAMSAVRRAVLNPQALTRLAGAGVGGDVGQAAMIASQALPGMKPYAGGLTPSPALAAAPMPEGWQLPRTSANQWVNDAAFASPPPVSTPAMGGWKATGTMFGPSATPSAPAPNAMTRATGQMFSPTPSAPARLPWEAMAPPTPPTPTPTTPMSARVTPSRSVPTNFGRAATAPTPAPAAPPPPSMLSAPPPAPTVPATVGAQAAMPAPPASGGLGGNQMPGYPGALMSAQLGDAAARGMVTPQQFLAYLQQQGLGFPGAEMRLSAAPRPAARPSAAALPGNQAPNFAALQAAAQLRAAFQQGQLTYPQYLMALQRQGLPLPGRTGGGAMWSAAPWHGDSTTTVLSK